MYKRAQPQLAPNLLSHLNQRALASTTSRQISSNPPDPINAIRLEEMKHPREEEEEEEEVPVSLELSLSTDSPASCGTSSTGGATSTAPSSAAANKRARRRRGPLVATSGEGDFVCKTCLRAFPTFQALGGHRTSHLRGRGRCLVSAKALEQHKADSAKPPEPPGQQHECRVCGLRYENGLALGGHMSRHHEEKAGDCGADESTTTGCGERRRIVTDEPPVLLDLFL